MSLFSRRVPLILQTEAPECGIACVAMIASYHGWRTDLAAMRLRLAPSMKGVTLAHILAMARGMGMSGRGLKTEPEGLAQLKLPCILHWDLNHFVVLVAADSKRITVHDPAVGRRVLSLAEAGKHFTGVAMELTPTPEFQRKDERQQVRASQLVGSLSGLRGVLVQVLLLSLALEVLSLAAPFFLQLAVDRVVVSRDAQLLTVLGVGFVGLALFAAAITGVRAWLGAYLSTHMSLRLQDGLFGKLLWLPMVWFEKRHIGDIVARFRSVDAIQKTLTVTFLESVMDGVMVLVTLALMAWYSLMLTAVVLGATLLYGLTRWLLYAPLRRATDEKLLHEGRSSTHFIETLRGMMAIKLNRRELERRGAYQNLLVAQANADAQVQRVAIVQRTAHALIFGLESVIVVWLGASIVIEGQLSVGMLFGFLGFKLLFINRIINLTDKLVEFRMLDLHAERVADITLTEPEPSSGLAVGNAPRSFAIEARGLGFAYGVEGPVFRGVDLDVQPGEMVAIVGPSGAGKTTLVKVLVGLLDRTEGSLNVGGRDLRDWDLGALRSRVGVVMQDDQLFVGSIEDNISFFDPHHDPKAVRACAKLAMVDAEVEAMPMGYNTLVGSLGMALSGGQKQRILLARALYRQPAVLFLDETFDQLDLALEQRITTQLRGLGMAIVIVSHRPDTVREVDRIIELKR
ncbi:peptidase domain-containing ABC transporter [Piscinibacterium candidicorallinum]|jgi:ATP-binding cassette subfamily B protein RaxB|uniref:Peptidase domain-containing ABC transporter n=1 Tax=Piscinibacterium candidicorallinum TaxID=1793872 RepID=A0ABV7H7M1_9BURK